MKRKLAGALLLPIISILLIACGNESFLTPLHGESSGIELRSLLDGQVLLPGDTVPMQIIAVDPEKNKDLVLQIDVYSPAGENIWTQRIDNPAQNEAIPSIVLPDLPTGQYRMELTLYSAGVEMKKISAVFFNSKSSLRIAGIKSYPASIAKSSPVLLKAEIDNPDGLDAYFRWTWRGKSIGKGLASGGFSQILWNAPEDEGVYAITLELFPSTPTGDESAMMRSSITMSTDIYVSKEDRKPSRELSPESSYYALYHLEANLKDSGKAENKAGAVDAALIGAAGLEPTDFGFGYGIAKGAGILIPWFALPVEDGTLMPFTVSMGVSVDSVSEGNQLLAFKSTDGSFSMVVSMDSDTLAPELSLVFAGASELIVPSNAPIQQGQRHLLSISLAPLGSQGFRVQWFLDGEQTNIVSASAVIPKIKADGRALIGGEGGISGTIDEFGVYSRDANDVPSTDPGLFAWHAREQYGESLILAEGFDGMTVPAGFSVDGKGAMAAGSITLPAGSGLTLPPLKPAPNGTKVDIAISPASRTADFQIWWEGSDSPVLDAQAAVQGGTMQLTLTGDTLTFQGPDGQKIVKVPSPAEKADLVIRIASPETATAAMSVQQVLVTERKE
jgi:hypothetical protein